MPDVTIPPEGLIDSMDEEQLRAEVRKLSRAIADADRSADHRSDVHLGQMIGGSDVCSTCSAHCNVMDEDQAEIKRMRQLLREHGCVEIGDDE